MLQPQVLDRADDLLDLIRVERVRPACRHIAEAAAARADIPSDHEGRGAPSPAFAAVGTHPRGADRVEMFLIEKSDDLTCLESSGQLYLKPVGLAAEIGHLKRY